MDTFASKSEQRRSVLDYIETQIDIWNRTANNKKRIITIWRKRITIAMLVGAALGLASEEFMDCETCPTAFIDGQKFGIPHALGGLSAVALALATFAGAKILSGELEKTQLNARAVCEALKVQGYLYAMKAPPYSGKNAEKNLFNRLETIQKDVMSITPDLSTYTRERSSGFWRFLNIFYMGRGSSSTGSEWKMTFDENMTFDAYIDERVMGQINGYYRKKAAQFQLTINRAKTATLFFGFAGVAFGAMGATYLPGMSMWIGLLGTASASITSYIHANKYEFLLHSYVSTAGQLELISARYKSLESPSLRLQQRFIMETETIFASEHNSWISEISGTSDDERDEDNYIEEGVYLNPIPNGTSDTDEDLTTEADGTKPIDQPQNQPEE